MTSNNLDRETADFENGKFIAVCCTSKLKRKDIDEFLKKSYAGGKELMGDNWAANFVVIDDLDKQYDAATESFGVEGNFSSPFVDDAVSEVFEKIRNLKRENGSSIATVAVVILNAAGAAGDWAYIAYDGPDKDDCNVVKVAWDLIQSAIGTLMVKTNWTEWTEAAEDADDGIIKG